MAITPSYEHSTVLKKVTVSGATYWLKDEDLRTLVESFGSAVYKDVVTTFNAEGLDIATEKATAAYIKEQIDNISGAVRFKGVVDVTGAETEEEIFACVQALYTSKSEKPKSGDIILLSNGAEYICTEGADTVAEASWEELGNQDVYETKAHASATYVPKTRTIAGEDLTADITQQALQNALGLDLLAYKHEASGTVEVLDTIADISAAKGGTYNVMDQSTVDVPVTYNALDVTPAGTVDLSLTTNVAASYQKTSSVSVSTSDATAEHPANYTPSGSVALPGVSSNLTLSGADVATVTDAGTAYALSASSVTKADDTTSKFVKKAVAFEVDAENQALSINYVNSGAESYDTFYGDAVTAAGSVSYVAPTLSGALPTFGTQNVALTTGATISNAYDGSATFSGNGVSIDTTVNFAAENATVTQPVFNAGFTGTSKSVTPSAATTATAAQAGGNVVIAAQDIPVVPTKKTVTVTVS